MPLIYAPDLTAADRRPIPNVVVEARKYSALAIDTLVELTKDNYPGSTRYNAASALLDRGYGRPAQSLDLHLSADVITKRLSDMTDAELAALEARMIAIPASVALEHVDEPQVDGDTDAEHGNDGNGGIDGAGSWRTATSRIPRRTPLPDSAPAQNSPAASLSDKPANIRRATDLA
jgi:hypothetical protein